jgi:hypothetical protein
MGYLTGHNIVFSWRSFAYPFNNIQTPEVRNKVTNKGKEKTTFTLYLPLKNKKISS